MSNLRITELVEELKNRKSVNSKVGYLGFVLSMIPIPGVQQVGMIADKITSNIELNERFESLIKQIDDVDSTASSVEDDVKRIKYIANTVDKHEQILIKVQELIDEILTELEREESEFIVDTKDWSIQTVIKQIIEADYVSVSAINHSRNTLKDTKIKSKKTHLVAHNNSINIIDGTEFKDGDNSVSMQGISQTGNIQVTGNSIGFGNNSAIIFGNPNVVQGKCPYCNYIIKVDKTKLYQYSSIQCPNCKVTTPFKM